MWALGLLGDPTDFDALASALANSRLRLTAVQALADQPDADRVDAAARSLLGDPDPRVRSHAAGTVASPGESACASPGQGSRAADSSAGRASCLTWMAQQGHACQRARRHRNAQSGYEDAGEQEFSQQLVYITREFRAFGVCAFDFAHVAALMLLILGTVLGVLFGGITGVFLGRWLTRAQPRLSVVAITQTHESDAAIQIPESIVDSTRQSKVFNFLQPMSASAAVEDEIAKCEEYIEEYPQTKEVLDEILSLIPRASESEKISVLEKILGTGQLERVIRFGLYVKDFQISPDGGEVDFEELRKDAQYFKVYKEDVQGGVTVLLELPRSTATLDFIGPQAAPRFDSAKAFMRALGDFNAPALEACVDYARQTMEKEYLRAEALSERLRRIVDLGPFEIQVVATNNGDRMAVLNPYATLVTTGAERQLPPILLRVVGLTNGASLRSDAAELVKGSPTYITLEPQSTKLILLTSEALENNVQLKSAYESEILSCSVYMVQQKANGGKKRLRTPIKKFGAGLPEELKEDATEIARRRRLNGD